MNRPPDLTAPSTSAHVGAGPEAGFLASASPFDLFSDPASLLAILWRGRRYALACLVGTLLIAGLYLLTAKRLYQANAKILVLEHGGMPLASAGDAVNALARGAEDNIPTHALLVASPVVLRSAVEAVGVNNLPSLDPSGGVDGVAREVAEGLTVTRPDRQAKILQVSFRARTPDEAVRVVKAVAESYQRFLEEVYAAGNGDVVVLMSRARDDLSRELKGLEQKYLEFRRDNVTLTGDAAGRPFIHQRVDEWDKASRDVMVRAVRLKAQLGLGRELARDGVGLWSIAHALDQVGDAPNGISARTQTLGPTPPSDYLRLLANEQQQLAERLGPQSTKVKEIQEQIAQAQSGSRRERVRLENPEIDDLLGSIEKSLKAIETMRLEIQGRFEQDMTVARKVEIEVLAEANLKSELDRQRKLFDSVVEQLKRATLVGGFSGTRCQVVEAPNAISRPVRPYTSLTLIMALAAGGVLGVAAALGAEVVEPRLRSAADVRRALRLPVLGQVPFYESPPGPLAAGPACQSMPRSPTAESFRAIRANLDLARRNRDARAVLVTGPEGGEGKSTVAVNLAVTLAQAGRRVLLVDADLRDPALHKALRLSRDRGLVHILRELLPPARVLQSTDVPNLDFLASGPEVANPAELISSPALADAVSRFRDGYDTVVIDAPPLGPLADASILASLADGVVLVVRAGVTRRADSMHAADTLRALGTPILGVVVNAAPAAAENARRPRPADAFAPAGDLSTVAATAEIPYDPRIASPSLPDGWDLFRGPNGHAGGTAR